MLMSSDDIYNVQLNIVFHIKLLVHSILEHISYPISFRFTLFELI